MMFNFNFCKKKKNHSDGDCAWKINKLWRISSANIKIEDLFKRINSDRPWETFFSRFYWRIVPGSRICKIIPAESRKSFCRSIKRRIFSMSRSPDVNFTVKRSILTSKSDKANSLVWIFVGTMSVLEYEKCFKQNQSK